MVVKKSDECARVIVDWNVAREKSTRCISEWRYFRHMRDG